MGAFQELVLACDLKPAVPQQVIDVLKYMINLRGELNPQEQPKAIPMFDHPLFTQYPERLHFMLRGEAYYLPGIPFSELVFDELFKYYKFTSRTMIKSGGWVAAFFLLWLAPYVETKGFVGYTRYDELPDLIDLIYFENGEVFYNRTNMENNPPTITRFKVTLEHGPYPPED